MVSHGVPVDALATLAGRAEVLRPLAEALNLPLIAMAREDIAGIATPTHSPRIAETFGTGCVAEALALAAIGPGGAITATRQISADGTATAAIASKNASQNITRSIP
jgi:cobalt-precorrin 5A hydrolase